MKKVLLYIEENLDEKVLELLEVVNKLYPNEDTNIYALNINNEIPFILENKIDCFLNIKDDKLKSFDQRAISSIYFELHNRYNFDAILFLATDMGRCLAPAVAMKLHSGLVADVSSVSNINGKIELIRPAYSGKIMAGIEIISDGPIMMSVRSGIFSYSEKKEVKSEYITINDIYYNYSNIQLLKTEKKEIPYDIRKSEVLVSAGAGCKKNLDSVKELSDLLDAKVSASRAVVDEGLVSRSIQVGQSGKTVSPKLYLALGIHGAIQHVEGLKDIDYIISANIDANAPICSISDMVVEGDANTFIQKLIKKIQDKK